MSRIFNRKTLIVLVIVLVFGYIVGKDRALRDNAQDDSRPVTAN